MAPAAGTGVTVAGTPVGAWGVGDGCPTVTVGTDVAGAGTAVAVGALRCVGVIVIVCTDVTVAGTPVCVGGIESECLTAAVGTDGGATEAGVAIGVNEGAGARPVGPPASPQPAASIRVTASAMHDVNPADATRLPSR